MSLGVASAGTSKPISVSTSTLSAVAIATCAAATPSTPWTVRLTWSSVTESAYAPLLSSTCVVMPPPSPDRQERGAHPPAGRGRTCGRPGPAPPPGLLVIGPERGQPGRELRDHLAVHRAVEQRRRQQRGRRRQRPDRRVHLGRRHPGRAVHREPAAQHVVAVRRQPVAAPDQRRPTSIGARAARARQPRHRHVDQAADHQRLRRRGAGRRPAPRRSRRPAAGRARSAARRAPRWPACRPRRRSGRPRRRTPRRDRGAAAATGPSGVAQEVLRARVAVR